ncbi:MAG: ABC transporter permease [Actinobacteria bacterium]|nr:ABC transporter permease [Actinomycetota bacterium]
MTSTLAALGAGFRAEIQQLRRSRLLVLLTVVEAVTFLVLVSIFGLTANHVPTAVVDHDGGRLARQWAQDMATTYSTYGVRYMDARSAQQALGRGDVAAILYIPAGFSQHMAQHSMIRIHFLVDNVNADLTNEVELGVPPVARAFAVANHFPGVRVVTAETDLVSHEVGLVPYLVISALALAAFVVAGTLAASATAREFEARTLPYLKLSPTHPLVPLTGRLLATAAVSFAAVAVAALLAVAGYGVVPKHPVELAGALLLCVLIFSCIGAAIGTVVRRTLPLSALIFGLALALYLDSGSLEPARFYGNRLWVIAHTSPVYYAVGILQDAVHGLRITPESIPVNFAALVGWALLAAGAAWLGLRRAVVA